MGVCVFSQQCAIERLIVHEHSVRRRMSGRLNVRRRHVAASLRLRMQSEYHVRRQRCSAWRKHRARQFSCGGATEQRCTRVETLKLHEQVRTVPLRLKRGGTHVVSKHTRSLVGRAIICKRRRHDLLDCACLCPACDVDVRIEHPLS